eukprot:TRINITY_DN1772_c0_g1_i13.p1 TRINITY_DN1772_c0_g1~~TRINITY_DN1772_c0_g1_i13.p1  ORF type:complete len:393 (-),score=83.57 TRINITY_DN1772_c0_g1_i13:55-1233(-)
MEARSLQNSPSISAPVVQQLSSNATLSPLLKTAERTSDPNEELKLPGKRHKANNSEKEGSKTDGRWTKAEHERFLEALKLYGKHWKLVEKHIGTRTGTQVRSHAQKHYLKISSDKQKVSRNKSKERQGDVIPSGRESALPAPLAAEQEGVTSEKVPVKPAEDKTLLLSEEKGRVEKVETSECKTRALSMEAKGVSIDKPIPSLNDSLNQLKEETLLPRPKEMPQILASDQELGDYEAKLLETRGAVDSIMLELGEMQEAKDTSSKLVTLENECIRMTNLLLSIMPNIALQPLLMKKWSETFKDLVNCREAIRSLALQSTEKQSVLQLVKDFLQRSYGITENQETSKGVIETPEPAPKRTCEEEETHTVFVNKAYASNIKALRDKLQGRKSAV